MTLHLESKIGLLNEEKVEATPQEQEQLMLLLHGDILNKLLQFPRFQAFIASNYEIKPNIDEENKAIGFSVREFSQQESLEIMNKALKEAKTQIVTATPEDLKNLDNLVKKNK